MGPYLYFLQAVVYIFNMEKVGVGLSSELQIGEFRGELSKHLNEIEHSGAFLNVITASLEIKRDV